MPEQVPQGLDRDLAMKSKGLDHVPGQLHCYPDGLLEKCVGRRWRPEDLLGGKEPYRSLVSETADQVLGPTLPPHGGYLLRESSGEIGQARGEKCLEPLLRLGDRACHLLGQAAGQVGTWVCLRFALIPC